MSTSISKSAPDVISRYRCPYTEDLAKILWITEYGAFGQIIRLQGFALVGYRLRAPHGWQGNQPFRV